jgi:signal transduction histidine kinase
MIGAVLDITERKQTENLLRNSKEKLEERVQERTSELDSANQQLRAEIVERKRAEASREEMMRALVAAQEAERGRISRELHDEIGQHLTALLLGLKALQNDFAPQGSALTTLESLQAITENVGREIHEVALELRPTALDDLGLVRALSTFLEDWAVRTKLEMQFDHSLGDERLPPHLETTLYRVVCEALHNIVRHAGATRASVILQRKPGQVMAIVEDNGVGFEVSGLDTANRSRLGIVGMKERVALVDGELTIESGADRGTTVIVRLPLP